MYPPFVGSVTVLIIINIHKSHADCVTDKTLHTTIMRSVLATDKTLHTNEEVS